MARSLQWFFTTPEFWQQTNCEKAVEDYWETSTEPRMNRRKACANTYLWSCQDITWKLVMARVYIWVSGSRRPKLSLGLVVGYKNALFRSAKHSASMDLITHVMLQFPLQVRRTLRSRTCLAPPPRIPGSLSPKQNAAIYPWRDLWPLHAN